MLFHINLATPLYLKSPFDKTKELFEIIKNDNKLLIKKEQIPIAIALKDVFPSEIVLFYGNVNIRFCSRFIL